jgi:integral membrane protein
MNPLRLFRAVAVAEAFTWAGLLTGMFLKRVTHTTDLGVQVFGMLHGIAFVAFGVATLVVAVDQQWSRGRTLLGLASAVPPFATIWFDRYAERRGLLDTRWHSDSSSESQAQRVVAWLLRHRRPAAALFVGSVAGLTSVALLVGPPAG